MPAQKKAQVGLPRAHFSISQCFLWTQEADVLLARWCAPALV